MVAGTLYYGDNLDILRRYVKDESVDLVYLDPPFNSNQDYNVLFQERDGTRSAAQIRAFSDTWRWDREASRMLDEMIEAGGKVSLALQSFRTFVGETDLLAYLSMMAPRLLELRRALKPTGSLYLHCDPTASHYLKMLLDAIFGLERFLNEITWKRTHSHGNVQRNFGSILDNILVYTKGEEYTWNQQFASFTSEYIDKTFKGRDSDGRRWQSVSLRNPGVRPNLQFPYKALNGVTYKPHPNGWVCTEEVLRRHDQAGRLHYPSNPDGALRLKMYLDESQGVRLQNLWDDIPVLGAQSEERLGYPTQKPSALLERIILTSSNPGEIVLDPFCGCGTAIVAAEKQRRSWIGIDITHLAITLIRSRLNDAFGDQVQYSVVGEPTDLEGARALANEDRYQFQWWALGKVDARPTPEDQRRGADRGVDGRLFFHERAGGMTKTIVLQVKSGHVSAADIRDLVGVIEREKAAVGGFLTLEAPTLPMRQEAASAGFYHPEYRLESDEKFPRIQLLTVEELLAGKKLEYPHVRNVTFKLGPEVPRESGRRRGRTSRLTELPGGPSSG